MASKRKKFIMVLCEGPTDEMALYPELKAFFDPSTIRFHICHGDPLTTYSDRGKDPMNNVKKIVRQEMKRYALRDSDVLAVFQITDTDGAFIPDSKIIEDPERHKISYGKTEIRTAFPASILSRNRKKRTNVLRVLEETNITESIPYRIYYVSRNIEHALYGRDEHLSDGQKGHLADDFADSFDRDWRALYNHIINHCSPLGRSYEESWEKIQEGTRSLERHTNLNFLFEDFSYLNYPSQ